MEILSELRHVIDPKMLLEQFTYVGIFAIVFAESGLFFGFFLPGDSLLLIAGIYASTGFFNIWLLIPLIFVAAFLGDQVGYWTGSKFGRRLFERENSRLFKKEHIVQAEKFFAQHGSKTVILARFVPIVRTFAPILAGAAKMPYSVFLTYNFIGAVLWGIGFSAAGYFLGNIPQIDKYIHYIVVAIILISVIPVIGHLISSKKSLTKKR